MVYGSGAALRGGRVDIAGVECPVGRVGVRAFHVSVRQGGIRWILRNGDSLVGIRESGLNVKISDILDS